MAELRHEVAELRAENIELRREVGYWKSRHARVVERNSKLQAELNAAKAEIRQLKDERFGKKSEKQSRVDRSYHLDDPQQRQEAPKRNVGGSREVRPRSGETIHICPHAFRKSMFRTTPRSVPAAVCHWKGLDKMTTANRLKSKR